MSDIAGSINGIISATKELFGRVAFVIFIASGALLLFPKHSLEAIGIPGTDANLRELIGLLFVIGADASLVSALIFLGPLFVELLVWLVFIVRLHRMPWEAQMALATIAVSQQSAWYVPDDFEPIQILLDRGFIEASPATVRTLRVILSHTGIRVVANHRGWLRAQLMRDPTARARFETTILGQHRV